MRKVSNMTEYEGYSEEIYDGYSCTSQYFTLYDGCKIAVDIYRPTKNGVLHEEKLPIIWCATQYKRSEIKPDGTKTNLEESAELWFYPGVPQKLIRYGYIIAVVDMRGTGASYGNGGLCTITLQEYYDLYDLNEMLAALPYTNGKTGMFGMSYLGSMQWLCALTCPPSLKCIVPNVAPMEDPYLRTNGIDNYAWTHNVDEGLYDKNVLHPAAPVDEDTDGSMLREAIEMHKNNPSAVRERYAATHFDDFMPYYGTKVMWEAFKGNFIHNIKNSDVACYIIEGLRDLLMTDCFDWYCTLTGPKRMAVGPWVHDGSKYSHEPYNFITEHLRWYDYWLKGIDNGIMDEDPLIMYNYGSNEWRTYDD